MSKETNTPNTKEDQPKRLPRKQRLAFATGLLASVVTGQHLRDGMNDAERPVLAVAESQADDQAGAEQLNDPVASGETVELAPNSVVTQEIAQKNADVMASVLLNGESAVADVAWNQHFRITPLNKKPSFYIYSPILIPKQEGQFSPSHNGNYLVGYSYDPATNELHSRVIDGDASDSYTIENLGLYTKAGSGTSEAALSFRAQKGAIMADIDQNLRQFPVASLQYEVE